MREGQIHVYFSSITVFFGQKGCVWKTCQDEPSGSLTANLGPLHQVKLGPNNSLEVSGAQLFAASILYREFSHLSQGCVRYCVEYFTNITQFNLPSDYVDVTPILKMW